MNGLKEHKYMDFLTTIGYIVFALCCVIGFFAHLYILFAVGFVLIFVLRLIGYSLDRFEEYKRGYQSSLRLFYCMIKGYGSN